MTGPRLLDNLLFAGGAERPDIKRPRLITAFRSGRLAQQLVGPAAILRSR
ncbi:hypothetical protein ACTXG6_16170 [Pseudonocardia sp. Cha107L01]